MLLTRKSETHPCGKKPTEMIQKGTYPECKGGYRAILSFPIPRNQKKRGIFFPPSLFFSTHPSSWYRRVLIRAQGTRIDFSPLSFLPVQTRLWWFATRIRHQLPSVSKGLFKNMRIPIRTRSILSLFRVLLLLSWKCITKEGETSSLCLCGPVSKRLLLLTIRGPLFHYHNRRSSSAPYYSLHHTLHRCHRTKKKPERSPSSDVLPADRNILWLWVTNCVWVLRANFQAPSTSFCHFYDPFFCTGCRH